MNSKFVQVFTIGVSCASLICAGVATYVVNTKKSDTVQVENIDEFLTANQDLLPQTVETIADNQGDNFLTALFTGKEIPDTDTDICIWAQSDDQNTQSILQDTSINLKLHYNKESSEMLTQIYLSENGNDTLSMNAGITEGDAVIYCPQIDQNLYTLSKDQFLYGFSAVSGIGVGRDVTSDDSDDDSSETDTSSTDNNSDDGSVSESELGDMFYVILSALIQDNVQVTEGDTVSLSHLGEEISGTTYICTPGSKDFQNMFNSLADYMDSHESARTYVHNMLGDLSLVNYNIGKIEKFLVNEDDILRDNAKSMADKLAKGNFNWTVSCDENGTGRYLNLSFTVKDTKVVFACEKSLTGASYFVSSLNDSFMSFENMPDASAQGVSSLGLSYGKTIITAGDKDHSSDIVVTTNKAQDQLTDETKVEFYGGAGIGNIEIHIESKASCSSVMPEVSEEFQKDMTTYSDEEVLEVFKTYRNGLTAILLKSKLLGIVL